jgi:hypothetical protein
LITKDLRCIKYELKKLKSQEVSDVVSSVDPSILKELRDNLGVAMSAADDANVTADEAKEGSADAHNAASEAQRDVIGSVQSSNTDHASRLSAISSETVKTAVRCMKYECEKKKPKMNVKSVDVSVSALGVDASVLHELRDDIADVNGAAEIAMATEDKAQKETLLTGRILLKTIFDASETDLTAGPAMRRLIANMAT